MPIWRDPRHPVEREADDRYAAGRTGRLDIAQAVTSTDAIDAAADKIVAARVLTQMAKEGKRMSKLGAIGERIAEKKLAHDKKADEWAARLDALDQREPGAFAIGDAVIDERETDLADMEKTMRTLSNLPNVVSKT